MGTDVHSVFQKKTAAGWEDVESQYDERRHYALFAWIGDVRNGYGFAGVPTHDRIEPLSSGRGLPEDFAMADEYCHLIPANSFRGGMAKYYVEEDSDPTSSEHLRKSMGDHSYSWLSAAEILAAPPPRILRTGIIGIEQFRAWDGNSSPESWSGGINGPGIVVAQSPSEVKDGTTHVRIEWFDDTSESFAYFIDEVRRLQDLHGEVRVVFGFDS